MATIVTTLLYVPAAVLLAAMSLIAGASIYSFVTLGGALHPVAGLFVWWAIFYLPSAVYSGFIVPWDRRDA